MHADCQHKCKLETLLPIMQFDPRRWGQLRQSSKDRKRISCVEVQKEIEVKEKEENKQQKNRAATSDCACACVCVYVSDSERENGVCVYEQSNKAGALWGASLTASHRSDYNITHAHTPDTLSAPPPLSLKLLWKIEQRGEAMRQLSSQSCRRRFQPSAWIVTETVRLTEIVQKRLKTWWRRRLVLLTTLVAALSGAWLPWTEAPEKDYIYEIIDQMYLI